MAGRWDGRSSLTLRQYTYVMARYPWAKVRQKVKCNEYARPVGKGPTLFVVYGRAPEKIIFRPDAKMFKTVARGRGLGLQK